MNQYANATMPLISPDKYFTPSISPQRRRGNCKFFNSQKGFGFVIDSKPEELDNQEVFVHWTAIQGRQGFKSLAEGEEVEYDLQQTPKGFSATNLSGPNGRPVIGDPRARSTGPSGNANVGYGFNTLADLSGQQLALDNYAGYAPYMQHQFLVNGGLSPALAAHAQMSPGLGTNLMTSPNGLNSLNRLPASLAQSGTSLPLVSPILQQQQMGLSPMMNSFSPSPLGYSSQSLGGAVGGLNGVSGGRAVGNLRNSPSLGGSGAFGGIGGINGGGLGIQDIDRFGGGAGGLGGMRLANGTNGSLGGGYGGVVSGMGGLNLEGPNSAGIGSPVPGSGNRSASGDEPQNGNPSRDLLYSTSYRE